MKEIFLRTPYNYDVDLVSDETGLKCEDVSLAVQSAKDECDINVIMEKFGQGQMVPENFSPPTYGDFEGIFDFQSAMNTVIAAQREFGSLLAKLRDRFGNDPAALMAFLADDSNREEAERLGLVNKPVQKVFSSGAGIPESPSVVVPTGSTT